MGIGQSCRTWRDDHSWRMTLVRYSVGHKRCSVAGSREMAGKDGAEHVHNHGRVLDSQRNRVQCKYCDKMVTGFNRLQHHLGGIRGNVKECPNVPSHVKEYFKSCMESRVKACNMERPVGGSHHHVLPSTQKSSDGVTKYAAIDLDRQPSNCNVSRPSRILPCTERQDSSAKAKSWIGRFLLENGMDLEVVESDSFLKLMKMAHGSGTNGLEIPNRQDLIGQVLPDELNDMKHYLQQIRHSWADSGCSILLDSWIDEQSHCILNILVNCPHGTIYVCSKSFLAVGDDARMESFLDGMVADVGLDNVVQIVSGGHECMITVGKNLMQKHASIFCTVSSSHCFKLILEEIGRLSNVEETINGVMIIVKFIFIHPSIISTLRRHFSSNLLSQLVKIKALMPFLMLKCILKSKQDIQEMVSGWDWRGASTPGQRSFLNLVNDESFWGVASIIDKATSPLLHFIYQLNDDHMHMGYVYRTVCSVRNICKEVGEATEVGPCIIKIIEKWNNVLHSPIHLAAYCLDPFLYCSDDGLSDSELFAGLEKTVIRLVRDRSIRTLVNQQQEYYFKAVGPLRNGSQTDEPYSFSPVDWWRQYWGDCPQLQSVAIKILSQTCKDGSSYELKHDLAEKQLSRAGNCSQPPQLRDLLYVQYNLHVKHLKLRRTDSNQDNSIDIIDEWVKSQW